jgi:hypothetical protein
MRRSLVCSKKIKIKIIKVKNKRCNKRKGTPSVLTKFLDSFPEIPHPETRMQLRSRWCNAASNMKRYKRAACTLHISKYSNYYPLLSTLDRESEPESPLAQMIPNPHRSLTIN